MRHLLALVLAVLPFPLKRAIGRRCLGWELDDTAYIGRSVVEVGRLVLGPGAGIGNGNTIRGLDLLELGEGASIGTRNRIIGWPTGTTVFPARKRPRRPEVVLGAHALITVEHTLDVADRIELGDHAAIAGFQTQVLTHSLNLVRDRQETGPVTIGHHTAIMSGCILLSGTSVPAQCVVSAGSVVATALKAERTFYRGNPAEAVRELPETLEFFRRGTPEYRHEKLPHQG